MIDMAQFQQFAEMWQAYQIFQQMQQPNPNPMGAAIVQPQAPTAAASQALHNATQIPVETQQLIDDLKKQLAAAQLEIQNLRAANEAQRHEAAEREGQFKAAQTELAQLRSDIAAAEAYYGEEWDQMISDIKDTSGQEYYDAHREQWQQEGYTGREMHDAIQQFRDAVGDEGPKMVDFADASKFQPHRNEDKVDRAKEEALRRNATGVMREIKDGPAQKEPNRGFDF